MNKLSSFFFLLLVSLAHGQITFTSTYNVTTTTNIMTSATQQVYTASAPIDVPAEFQLPNTGTNWLTILDQTNVQLYLVATNTSTSQSIMNRFNFGSADGQTITLPAANKFVLRIGTATQNVVNVDFKRLAQYAPNETNDLRYGCWLTLQCTNAIAEGDQVQVTNPDGTMFTGVPYSFVATSISNRFNPSIHVNTVGYHPSFPKMFEIGTYLGTNLLEYAHGTRTFNVYDVDGGTNIYTGTTSLYVGEDGWYGTVKQYQKVQRGDFSAVTKEGQYYIQIPLMGRSASFRIDRNYSKQMASLAEVGLYGRRCGMAVGPPYTSWSHGVCHSNLNNYVMTNASQLHWTGIKGIDYALAVSNVYGASWDQSQTNGLSGWKWAWANQAHRGTIGGWHDAGDYSKYTINIAHTVANLISGVDNFTGLAGMDNLGVPESGDGIPDLIQEAKWGADFLLSIQDTDGGFAFLVYPDDKAYENNQPDVVQRQVLYPKNTSGSALAVGALAELGSSPVFKKYYPAYATNCIRAATNGWAGITNQINTYGLTNSFQLPYSYGTTYGHHDELAYGGIAVWAATGAQAPLNFVTNKLTSTLTASITRHPWGWWYLWEGGGKAVLSMANAEKSGRRTKTEIAPYQAFWASATNEIIQAEQNIIYQGTNSAYWVQISNSTKVSSTAPYIFNMKMVPQAIYGFELRKFYGMPAEPNTLKVVVGAQDYDLGANPGNRSRMFGVGQNTPKVSVDQWQRFGSGRIGAATGWLIGSLFGYAGGTYQAILGATSWPLMPDNLDIRGNYPLYDRVDYDAFSVTTSECVVEDQGWVVPAYCWLAAQAAASYTNAQPQVTFSVAPQVSVATVLTATQAGIDNSGARIMWEINNRVPPTITRQLSWTPTVSGSHTINLEVKMPDGNLYTTTTNITVSP